MITDHLPSILALVVCVILSAYFSATETAFSSINRTRLRVLEEKGNKRAALVLALAEDYDKLISTILIGNNIVNIAASAIATLMFVSWLGGKGATVSTVVVTVVVLIFGEITPKSIAKDQPERFAMFSAPLIRLIMWLFLPLNFIFAGWKKLIGKIFHTKDDEKMSQEELLMLLEEVEQEGGLDEEEGELIRNAVEFGDLEAQDILTHRIDLEAVPLDADKETIAAAFTESRFSRILVYEDSIDHIVGVIHQKDFYRDMGVIEGDVAAIMAAPVYGHQTEKVDDLLRLLQASKSHIAVVIDEYGGTLGIVTMEDILEELVGEIWDEHDEVVEPFRKIDGETVAVDATVNLDDFCDYFGVETDSECVSLGGWIMEQMERIPVQGESFTYENLTVTVEVAEEHRIETVSVRIAPREEA